MGVGFWGLEYRELFPALVAHPLLSLDLGFVLMVLGFGFWILGCGFGVLSFGILSVLGS